MVRVLRSIIPVVTLHRPPQEMSTLRPRAVLRSNMVIERSRNAQDSRACSIKIAAVIIPAAHPPMIPIFFIRLVSGFLRKVEGLFVFDCSSRQDALREDPFYLTQVLTIFGDSIVSLTRQSNECIEWLEPTFELERTRVGHYFIAIPMKYHDRSSYTLEVLMSNKGIF